MSAGELVAAATAAAALLTALGTAAANIALLIPILRHARQTHSIVNQRQTDAAIYQAITTDALVQNGIPVPPDPALSAPQAAPTPQG